MDTDMAFMRHLMWGVVMVMVMVMIMIMSMMMMMSTT